MSDLYVKCPRSRVHMMVSAVTEIGDGWRPTRREYFSCPLCSGTGEADANDARE